MGKNYYERRHLYSDSELVACYLKNETLDHIIPLSKGGTHTWDNVQLAHMSCNAGKCDRLSGGEQ